MAITAPRAVVRRRREDTFIPPFVEKCQSGILRELLQKPSIPKSLAIDRGILRLPGRLFGNILDFLPLRDRNAISLTSRGADATRWNACILTVLPKAYYFYQKILETENPCKKHWDALCEASYKFGCLKIENLPLGLTAFITFNNSQFLFRCDGFIGSVPELITREAFPQYSVRGLEALKLVEYLKVESFEQAENTHSLRSKILELLCHKLSRGHFLYGMLGQRHFWVIGEEHDKENDVDFFKLAVRASEKNIALFSEGYIAGEESASIPINGLDSSDCNSGLLQVFASLLLTTIHTNNVSSELSRLFEYLSISLENLAVLYNALILDISQFPQQAFLSRVIYGAVNWESSLKRGDIFSSEKMDEICKIAETNAERLMSFLYIIGGLLAKESERFTPYEHQIFKEALDNLNLETRLQCKQIFLRKRDESFAENFLRALPSIPSSRPLVAIVGATHQWGFFSRVMSGYYQQSQKYAAP